MRFVHVLRIRDSYQVSDGESSVTEWTDRPVRTVGMGRAIGHFELWVCRGCGLTHWTANAWEPDTVTLRSAHCDDCDAPTPHAQLPAVEHASDYTYADTRLTRGMLGGEGSMLMHVCSSCHRVEWRALDYALLDGTFHVRYRRARETDRRCLRCEDDACLLDDAALEAESRQPIALGPKPRSLWQRVFDIHPTFGRFQLRVCLPCGSLEWYGHDLDAVIPSDNVKLVGDASQTATMGGPYR